MENFTKESSTFIKAFNHIASEVHNNAVGKGWWKEERNEGEILMLIVSELAEALEALRSPDESEQHLNYYEGVEVELADVIIRIMDYAKAKGYRVAEALIAKASFNKTRLYKHGKKF